MIQLGVNIDHIATLRNVRGGVEPEPLTAAELAMLGGASSITVHLREDRRHIRDRDVELLQERLNAPLNLEMSLDYEIAEMALKICPAQATLVPEKRQELTTEGGLDVIRELKRISPITEKFRESGIRVALFVEPDITQLQACLKTSSRTVELHTGSYANAKGQVEKRRELDRLAKAALWCADNGLRLHAGHGLNYHNTYDILHLPGLSEVNIGHSIIARAVFVGMERAVRDMISILHLSTTQGIIDRRKQLQDHPPSGGHGGGAGSTGKNPFRGD